MKRRPREVHTKTSKCKEKDGFEGAMQPSFGERIEGGPKLVYFRTGSGRYSRISTVHAACKEIGKIKGLMPRIKENQQF